MLLFFFSFFFFFLGKIVLNGYIFSTYIDPEKIQEGYEEWVIVQKNSFGR